MQNFSKVLELFIVIFHHFLLCFLSSTARDVTEYPLCYIRANAVKMGIKKAKTVFIFAKVQIMYSYNPDFMRANSTHVTQWILCYMKKTNLKNPIP